MSEQAHIADIERALQTDLETAIAECIQKGVADGWVRLLCYQCGVDYETIKQQESGHGN